MKIKKLRASSDIGIDLQKVVKYRSPGSVGISLISCDTKTISLDAIQTYTTGIAVMLPAATCGIIIPQNELAEIHGLIVLGGIIDSDYRGEIAVTFKNEGAYSKTIYTGDRIAQLVVLPYHKVSIEWLGESEHFTQI